MRQYRLSLFGIAIAAAVAAQSLVGRSEQAGGSPDAQGPFDALHFRSIGPASMSGRIADLAVYEANPSIYYVGTAHGGVWKTVNNGTTFQPQLQDQGLMSIGDVTISQSNPDLVWVGTGESNNRQSTSWGDGVYKSTDGGKTYVKMGLRTSRHIHRIVIDPRDNDVVLVAATGSLWGPGGERGVFKTTDGGHTWKRVLEVDEDTGANDLVLDPTNSQIVYATTYQRRRSACCMNGGGPGSGIWKSTDGGETWTRMKGNGIPEGPLGRIAVDVYRRRPNILYALIEGPAPQTGGRGGAAQAGATPAQEPPAAGQRPQGPGQAPTTAAREVTPPQPTQGPAGGGVQPSGAEEGPGATQQAGGGRGGNQPLNNLPTGLYRSDDSGATWRKVNNANPRPMYFSKVRIDPTDPDVVYLGGVGLHQTLDGGKTMATDVAASTHDDVHAIWINPANPDHVLIGNDGGLAASYDRAKTWVFLPNLPVGLFYHVSYDMATPYNVCGGMQDNYAWCGPSAVRGTAGIANHHWTTLQGGDGFVVLQDPADYRVAFAESQDGNIVRVDRVTGETMSVRPQAPQGEAPLRWHWDTPLVMSPHDPRVVYAAANKVFRSPDRGLSWTAISPDLTSGANRDEIVTMGVKGSEISIARNDGIAAWPVIVSFAESPRRAGVLYAGTDDGRLQVSRDGGKSWTNIFSNVPGLPEGIFVSEVVPSRFDEGTVYATFDGHRQNDFQTYIFASRDFGQTWRAIRGSLDGEIARTLTEDIKNPDVLYLGTETGLFVSLDRGQRWTRIKANLPTVRIDEITLHPRDNAMILATHGRALWILDSLSPIQEYAAVQTTTADAKLFTPPSAVMYRRPARDRNYEFWGDQTFFGQNPPQAAVIAWHLKRPVGEVTLRITDAAGRDVREISGPVLANSNKAGMQFACWDLRVQPAPAVAGRGGRGGGRGGEGQSEPQGGGRGGQEQRSPFGAGCGTGSGFGGGFAAFVGGGTAGPFVLPGVYTIALIVDGKSVDSRPLRVVGDPEVVLTDAERRRLFDMAMDVHELHRRAVDTSNAFVPLNTRVGELMKEAASRTDIPADVKTSLETLAKDAGALAPKLTPPAGGRGGGSGRGTASDNLLARIGQTKSALMGGMWPTEQTIRNYNDAKKDVPKTIADAQALMSRAAALAPTLGKYNLSLPVPAPVKTELR